MFRAYRHGLLRDSVKKRGYVADLDHGFKSVG